MARTNQFGRWLGRVVTLGIALALVGGSVFTHVAVGSSTSAPRSGVLLGAYANAKGGQTIFEAVTDLESQIGRKLAVVNKYHPWTDHSYGFEEWNLKAGRLPMISWRATDDTAVPNRAQQIADGQFDGLIRTAANDMQALHGPVLLRWNWEMDQEPGDRQYIGGPGQFIQAWRHIYDIFQNQGATNVEFLWAPRAGSFKKDEGQTFYPGDASVDWIGGSAVPISNYASFDELYGAFYDWASKKDKPLVIWSGIQEKPGDAGWKANWFDKARQSLKSMPAVKAWVYYHAEAPKGGDYWIDTSAKSLSSYRQISHDDYFSSMAVLDGGSGGGGGGGGGSGGGSGAAYSVVFSDDFETGDLSHWNVSTEGIGVQAAEAFAGVWAARQTSGGYGSSTYARVDLPTPTARLKYETRFKVVSDPRAVSLLKVQTAHRTILSINVTADGTLVAWNGVAHSSSGQSASIGAWHHLSVLVKVSGRSGQLELVLDGNRVASISGAAHLGTTKVTTIQLGNDTDGRTFDVAFDDVKVSAP